MSRIFLQSSVQSSAGTDFGFVYHGPNIVEVYGGLDISFFYRNNVSKS